MNTGCSAELVLLCLSVQLRGSRVALWLTVSSKSLQSLSIWKLLLEIAAFEERKHNVDKAESLYCIIFHFDI